jgi:hypothetical protein
VLAAARDAYRLADHLVCVDLVILDELADLRFPISGRPGAAPSRRYNSARLVKFPDGAPATIRAVGKRCAPRYARLKVRSQVPKNRLREVRMRRAVGGASPHGQTPTT